MLRLLKSHKSFEGEVRFYEHDSMATKTPMRFSVFLPDQAKNQPVPILLWLSGLTCNEENFMAKAGAQKYASKAGLCLVAPDTSPRGTNIKGEHDHWDFGSGAGFYLNATTPLWSDHYRMEAYVMEELPRLLSQHLPVRTDRMSISGHSMGGHGALTLALRYPARFLSVSAFSPICSPTQCSWGKKAFMNYLGDNEEVWKEYDTCEILKNRDCDLPILIDQGTADAFLEEQLKTDLLKQVCDLKNFNIKIRMQEGYDHSYYFIASYISEHIAFHHSYINSMETSL